MINLEKFIVTVHEIVYLKMFYLASKEQAYTKIPRHTNKTKPIPTSKNSFNLIILMVHKTSMPDGDQ